MASGISFGDLLTYFGPRDIATVEEILIERHEASKPAPKVGEAVFH